MFWIFPQHALYQPLPVIQKPSNLNRYILPLYMINTTTTGEVIIKLLGESWALIRISNSYVGRLLEVLVGISSISSKEQATYNEDEYIVGSGEIVDRFILLTSPAMSCLE